MITVAVDASMLSWPQGGIGRYLRNALGPMVAAHDVRFRLLTNSSVPVTNVAGAEEVPIRVKTGFAWRNVAVTRHLAKTQPDVYWAPWLLAPLRVPVPLVVTIHDIAPVFMPNTKPLLERLAFRTTFRWTARRADQIIADSAVTARDIRQHYAVDPTRVRVVPLGVDPQFTPAAQASAAEAVAVRWGITEPFVLVVGTIEPRKGIDAILAAAETLGPRCPRIVLAGRPGYRSGAILKRAAATSRCQALGAITDSELVDLYRAADALALPSLYEGFGLTPLEAMACGTPVVAASKSGSVDDLFSAAAIFVDRESPREWAAAFRRAVAERSAIADRGKFLAAKFTWAATAQHTLAALQEAASAGVAKG